MKVLAPPPPSIPGTIKYNTGLTDPMAGINGQIKLTMRVGMGGNFCQKLHCLQLWFAADCWTVAMEPSPAVYVE